MTTFKAISPVLMQVLSIWKPGQVKTPSIKMHCLPACPCLHRNKVEEMQSALDDSLAAAAEAASAPGGNIELVQQLSERLNQAGRREAAYVEQLDVLRAECWGLGEQLREAHLELEAEGSCGMRGSVVMTLIGSHQRASSTAGVGHHPCPLWASRHGSAVTARLSPASSASWWS